MSVYVEHSQVIDRPVDKVFEFMVDNHVQNHPRWDSDMELWLEDDEPIQMGTVIHRRNSRSGQPVEGTMEVVEFERDKSFATLIKDGPMEILGRVVFEPVGGDSTKVTQQIDFKDLDEGTDMSFLKQRLQEAGEIRKNLIETEID